jgi:putative peptidoglycan lipid II flippase
MSDPNQEHQIARSASIISIGDVLSRVMGLVRETVIADMFGASGAVSAWTIATQVPLTLYDTFVGGLVSSALVPTFSEYAAPGRRQELWHIASLVLTLAALGLGFVVLILELGLPLFTRLLVQFEDPSLQILTMRLLRIVVLGVFFLGLSGILTALCQALRRFVLPAFTAALYNAAIVASALILGSRWRDVRVLAIGLVVGAALQIVLQIPALRGMRFHLTLDLRHPVLRHILTLYSPVILSLVVALLGVFIDRNLASRTGNKTASWMGYATTLRQLPLGLVSIAISTAILPTLSAQAAQEEGDAQDGEEARSQFRATLAGGLRLVLVLTLPAAVGLLVLARPLAALLFQHGEFTEADTLQTALALRYYLVGMVGYAVDYPLVFAFYARKDTFRPAMVGVLGVVIYLLVAMPTYRTLGMVGLILANDAQLVGHAMVMIGLFERRIGTLRGLGIGRTTVKSLLASALMGGATYGTTRGVELLFPAHGRPLWAITVLAGGVVGLGVYAALCALLRVDELQILLALAGRLVASRRGHP